MLITDDSDRDRDSDSCPVLFDTYADYRSKAPYESKNYRRRATHSFFPLSLSFSSSFISSKNRKKRSSLLFEFEEDITLLWWYSRVIFYDAIHFQNLFYDEETRNESLVSFLLQFSIEFKKKRKGIGPFIEWNIKCKLTFVKIRRSLFESNDKNCDKLYWDSKLKVGISDSRMFEKLKKSVK